MSARADGGEQDVEHGGAQDSRVEARGVGGDGGEDARGEGARRAAAVYAAQGGEEGRVGVGVGERVVAEPEAAVPGHCVFSAEGSWVWRVL